MWRSQQDCCVATCIAMTEGVQNSHRKEGVFLFWSLMQDGLRGYARQLGRPTSPPSERISPESILTSSCFNILVIARRPKADVAISARLLRRYVHRNDGGSAERAP
jgi:hypothetical protein